MKNAIGDRIPIIGIMLAHYMCSLTLSKACKSRRQVILIGQLVDPLYAGHPYFTATLFKLDIPSCTAYLDTFI